MGSGKYISINRFLCTVHSVSGLWLWFLLARRVDSQLHALYALGVTIIVRHCFGSVMGLLDYNNYSCLTTRDTTYTYVVYTKSHSNFLSGTFHLCRS